MVRHPHCGAGIDKNCARLILGLSQVAAADELKAKQRAIGLSFLDLVEVSESLALPSRSHVIKILIKPHLAQMMDRSPKGCQDLHLLVFDGKLVVGWAQNTYWGRAYPGRRTGPGAEHKHAGIRGCTK